LIVGLDLREKK